MCGPMTLYMTVLMRGVSSKFLNIIVDYTREYLAIRGKRKLNSRDVIDALSDLFLAKGIPKFFRSDNSLVFSAQSVRDWIHSLSQRLFIMNHAHHGCNGIVNASKQGSKMNF